MQPTKTSQLPVNLGQTMDEFEVSTLSSQQSLSSISSQCSEMQEEIMAEELLKVMNFAASKIQALWRGYCTRKQLYIEQGAAMLLQAFWRGYQVRKLLQVPVSKPLLIHVKSLASWAQSQEQQQLLQACQIHIQSRQYCQRQSIQLPIQKGPMWTSSLQQKILAATIIQAYWRGYVVRRDLAIKTGAAIFIQSFYRGYLARRNLKANSTPDPIPQDEEAKMVAYNMSFGPDHFKTQTPVPESPQWNSSSFQTGLRKVSSPRSRLAENASFLYSGNNDCVSGKGDTVQATKPRRLLSWYPDSRQENDTSAGTMSTIRVGHKSNLFVPGYFIEGAGDTTSMSGQYSTIQTQPNYISPVRDVKEKGLDPVKSGKWEKHQNVKNKDRICQQNILGITAARPKYSYRGQENVEGKGERNKSVSQYLVKCTPYASGKARKLIRYREDSSSVSSLSDQSFNEAPVSKLDFDLSELEVPRRSPSCCRKSSARKTLKQMREESTAAGTIQAVWKGHCARRFLRQQADAATKIQAIFRSYRIRKEFANEGIFPLVYAKDSCRYLNKERESQTASSSSNRPQFGGGSESPGDGATDYPTASTPGDSQRTGTDPRHINSESETFVQPSQRLETAKREMPVCSSATPVLEAEETPSSSPPAVTPGSEGRKCSQTHHWMQKTVPTRKQYQVRIRAACTIQAVWRGHQTRCSIRKQSEAATKIQAHFRGFRIRKLMSNIEREEDLSDSTDGTNWETPDSETADAPDYLYLKTEVVSGHAAREPPRKREARIQVEFCCQHNPAWRDQAKPDGPAIFVKRNPCYNPRKVTIHVKAAGGDMS